MKTLLKNAQVFQRDGFRKRDVLLDDNLVRFDFSETKEKIDTVFDLNGLFLIPGFVDVHVHFREPGFLYKETIRTGSMAAAHGGYTAVCAMPNLKPVPSNLENLKVELDAIQKDAVVKVYPYGAITENQSGRGALADMEALAPYVCGFTDDGKGVQTGDLMREAMLEAKRLGKMIVAHCEDEAELRAGGCIHDGAYAAAHGHIGINSASEWKQAARDIALAKETGVHYHICHVSTKETVELVRRAKAEGVHVTCETGPHYLMYTDMDLEEDGKWKMNPPIRSAEDRAALIEGIKDGTIDCLITDHAPHSAEEKSRGLDHSVFGIVGLETAFASMYRYLVLADPLHPERKEGCISLEKLLELMCENPRRVFGLEGPSYVEDGCLADLTVLDLEKRWTVDVNDFYSMGKSTLYEGKEMQGEVALTFVNGKLVYDREKGITA